ncbi:hypothetical protein FOZ60_014583 [Perkinsus olseni]|uniref:Uncharacterized protein n=1 Tax=Perkinsus olseni TaxID=32597 RepID=A0A7J6N718_PEROL|nr:hypothetical protein FOZ60_014583 [Perkinsus olseni]KAF4739863.1 hypothetical protein FOZ62_025925 [Perkinsus olseni]
MVLGLFLRRGEVGDGATVAAGKTPSEEIDTIAGSASDSVRLWNCMQIRAPPNQRPRRGPYSVDYVQMVDVSEGRHGREMGVQAKLLTTVVDVIGSVVRPPAQPLPASEGGLLTQRFPEMVPITSSGSAYLVFSLTCGEVEISTLHKFADISAMSALLDKTDPSASDLIQLLETDLAFILQPAGSALRHLPVKGPKDADAIAKAFGRESCSMRRYTHPVSGAKVVDLCIDLFSMRIVKHLFPKLAFSKGRQTDIFVTDFNSRTCLCAFRLEATESLITIASG